MQVRACGYYLHWIVGGRGDPFQINGGTGLMGTTVRSGLSRPVWQVRRRARPLRLQVLLGLAWRILLEAKHGRPIETHMMRHRRRIFYCHLFQIQRAPVSGVRTPWRVNSPAVPERRAKDRWRAYTSGGEYCLVLLRSSDGRVDDK